MSTRLKRIVGMLVGTALSVAMFAVLPRAAEARVMVSTSDTRSTDRVVVAPGDSLWSISSERLGPQATPRQIDREVERVYVLNRNRIGPNPDIIFPGQEAVAAAIR